MSELSYLDKNEGVITASKLKRFLFCEKSYEFEYEQRLMMDEETQEYFLQGQCFEDYFVLGPDEWRNKWGMMGEGKKRRPVSSNGKIWLTHTAGKVVLQAINEAMRQPKFDLKGDYQDKVALRAAYKGNVIGGELDRFSLKKKQIRDFKLIANVERADWAISDKGFDYIFSMAFYQLLVHIEYEELCHATLDFVDKNGDCSRSRSITIPKDQLLDQRPRIIDALSRYIEAKKNNDFPMAEQRKRVSTCMKGKCPFYSICPGAIQQEEEFYDPHLRRLEM